MNGNQKIGVALAVLAGLGGIAYMQTEKDKKIGTSETTAEALPDIKLASTDDLTKIDITNEKGNVVLEKVGDKWELAKPVKAPANLNHVKSLFDNLKELKASELISKEVNDDLKKTYELGSDKGTHVILYRGDSKAFDATFGKSGGRGQMAIVDGKPGIYGVKGYSPFNYSRDAKAWRDGEIFKFDDTSVATITVAKKDGTKLVFTKKDEKWTGAKNDAPLERFDAEKPKELLRALKGLSAEDYGDGKSAQETGLDAPEVTVTTQLKDNGAKFVLKVGKVATGTNRYVQREGDTTNFIIGSYPSEWVAGELSKFQTPVDAGAPPVKKDGGK